MIGPVALLIACGSGGGEGAGRPATTSADCFGLLDEPTRVDCTLPEPLAARTREHRNAAGTCLVDANRAARERAERSALDQQHLTVAALPTVVYAEPMEEGTRTYPSDRLVRLRTVSAVCSAVPLEQSLVARNAAQELVQVDLIAEIARRRRVDSCACTGCGPRPPSPQVEFAILPEGQSVLHHITVPWPAQVIDAVSLVGACS